MKKMIKKLKEGKIVIHDYQDTNGLSKSIVARLKCETDFLAKSEIFSNALTKICEAIEKNKETETIMEELKKESGEKIEFIHTVWFNHEKNLPSSYYLHHDNKKVAFVQLKVDEHQKEAKNLARDIAMHVVAFSPNHVSEEDPGFSWDNIDLEISEELLKNKPPEIVEKIRSGKKAKYKKENILLDQLFVKNPDKTIAEEIAEFNKTHDIEVKVLGILEMSI